VTKLCIVVYVVILIFSSKKCIIILVVWSIFVGKMVQSPASMCFSWDASGTGVFEYLHKLHGIT